MKKKEDKQLRLQQPKKRKQAIKKIKKRKRRKRRKRNRLLQSRKIWIFLFPLNLDKLLKKRLADHSFLDLLSSTIYILLRNKNHLDQI